MKKTNHLFILDTNVLIHDPTALFKFQEHDIFLPMAVLEELDNNKKGHSDVARNARQASRFLDELTCNVSAEDIINGIPLITTPSYRDETDSNYDEDSKSKQESGLLFFQNLTQHYEMSVSFPGHKNDNDIIAITHALQQENNYKGVVLVSKDINLRIKAASIGVKIEDYHNDRAIEDVDLLHNGFQEYANDFWNNNSKDVESWHDGNKTLYKITSKDTTKWYPNEFISINDEAGFDGIVREVIPDLKNKEESSATVEQIKNYMIEKHNVWGINARNKEQNYALNLLMDPNIDFVTLLGQAGTGKTLLTLAAALSQVLDSDIYKEIIMTRATISVGEDIGFLPGTEEEKLVPWMGALMDNLEVLNQNADHSDWGKAATNDILTKKIKIRAMNFMRGRTFLSRFVIIDEAQNLTPKQLKTLITRAGPDTKIVCLGNLAQIDTPYLTETSSGLTYAVDRFRNWEHSGHVTLQRGERSRLADFAADVL
ncbi:MAG: PhoH family protein [Gammaproteobacteria bacterium]|nr:PhoH family protein [Gammaproteobacteria bacterium]